MRQRVLGVLVAIGISSALLASGVAVASPASTKVSQTYTCAVPILGNKQATITITGKASKNTLGTKINLRNVVFTFTNSFGLSATVNHIKFSVPDPNNTSAPYVNGTAKTGTTPAGWTGGHDTTGIFALFAGSMTVANGQTVANAPLRADYKILGPAGTVISFRPGQVSFNLTAPVSGTVTCNPNAPVQVFTSVTE